MSDTINIQSLNPANFEFQEYSSSDLNLINAQQVEVSFNSDDDYIEYYIYDLSGSIIASNIYGFPGYKLINNQVSIDPVGNLASFGYEQGSYNTLYNFLKRKLSSSPNSVFYIQDISSDRTELRLNTTQISNNDVVDLTTQFASQIANATGSYLDFYLDFGNNQLVDRKSTRLNSSHT